MDARKSTFLKFFSDIINQFSRGFFSNLAAISHPFGTTSVLCPGQILAAMNCPQVNIPQCDTGICIMKLLYQYYLIVLQMLFFLLTSRNVRMLGNEVLFWLQSVSGIRCDQVFYPAFEINFRQMVVLFMLVLMLLFVFGVLLLTMQRKQEENQKLKNLGIVEK